MTKVAFRATLVVVLVLVAVLVVMLATYTKSKIERTRKIDSILSEAKDRRRQAGLTHELFLDTVRRLSEYRTDVAARDRPPVFGGFYPDLTFLIDCYTQRSEIVPELANKIASNTDDGYEGLHLMHDGGLGADGFRDLWRQLPVEARRNIALMASFSPENRDWILPLLQGPGITIDNAETRALFTVARMHAGELSPDAVALAAREDASPVFRAEVGAALAINKGRWDGLELFAEALKAIPPARQRSYMHFFAAIFVPPLAEVSRLGDESDGLEDLLAKDWPTWLAENRNRLNFRDERWHLMDEKVKAHDD